jgi:hypothetical protein
VFEGESQLRRIELKVDQNSVIRSIAPPNQIDYSVAQDHNQVPSSCPGLVEWNLGRWMAIHGSIENYATEKAKQTSLPSHRLSLTSIHIVES